MADNVALNTAIGAYGATVEQVAADEIAGVKHQRVKLEVGVAGSATDVSTTNPLPTTEAVPTVLLDGIKTVASAAAAAALAGVTSCRRVLVQALSTNTAAVKIGSASGQSIELQPGDAEELEIANLATVYVKVAVDGEGVAYHAVV